MEGCEIIGQGANGKVYRINGDTIVKVYLDSNALPEIERERELARAAFVAGIPTAIPYDVVLIEGGGYGSVYEMLNAQSFARLLARNKKTQDEAAEMSIDLLRRIHSKVIPLDIIPSMKDVALNWVGFMKDHLPADQVDKLQRLVEEVPDDIHMLHGDYHIKNVMLQDGEALLIDMDTLCHGYPVFELASMFNAYVGYGVSDHSRVEQFLGLPYEICGTFWKKSLEMYMGTDNPARLREAEDKAKIIGYTRIMRREIRRNGLNTEAGHKLIRQCRDELDELLPRVDTLLL